MNSNLLVRQGQRRELIERGLLVPTASQAEADAKYKAVQRSERKARIEASNAQWESDASPAMSFGIFVVLTGLLAIPAIAFSSGVWTFIAVVVGLSCFWAWLSAIGAAKKRKEQAA